jgi:hypothetical protein
MSDVLPAEVQALLAEQLGPSATLREGIETHLPALWSLKAAHKKAVDLPDLRDAGEEIPAPLARKQEEASGELVVRAKDIEDTTETLAQGWVRLFDAEWEAALERLNILDEDHQADVLYEWSQAAHALSKLGLDQPEWSPQERITWRRHRGLTFWNGLMKHQDPEQRQHIPAGPLRDWGLAMMAAAFQARQYTCLESLSERRRAWLDALQEEGHRFDQPEAGWYCSSPRQLNSADNTHTAARDTRSAAMRRDDHYWAHASSAPNAWSAWLDQVGRPAQHPATCDWEGRLASLHQAPRKHQPVEAQIEGLMGGLDPKQVLAWQNNDPAEQREGGITWVALEKLATDNRQEGLLAAWSAWLRLHQAPLPPEGPSRRRVRM